MNVSEKTQSSRRIGVQVQEIMRPPEQIRERMRLRRLSGSRDEFHLAAIVQNLKSLALRTLRPSPIRQRAAFA
jgi:hypothetical protein